MVCLGNICRSPLAHGILENKIRKNNLDIMVDSAGTGSWHIGKKPDKRSIAVANKNGISINNQRARQITSNDLENFDLIYAMDVNNYNDIKKLNPSGEHHHKIRLILDNSFDKNVPDPYYGGEDGFNIVFNFIYPFINNMGRWKNYFTFIANRI